MAATAAFERPLPMRIAAASTLVVIVAWAAVRGDFGEFGVIAYPAIIALQTAREWLWRLEVSRKGVYEKPGVGPARTIEWSSIDAVLMPNANWWRINPVLRVTDGPNVQMTAMDDVDIVFDLAVQKGKEVIGSADSVTMVKSVLPWIVLLALGSLLLGAELAGRSI